MRNYEAMFIFNPVMLEEKLEKEIKHVEKAIKTHGRGEVKLLNLGKKSLAFPIKKFNEGVYVNYQFSAVPPAIAKIKHALRHRDNILRLLVILKGDQA